MKNRLRNSLKNLSALIKNMSALKRQTLISICVSALMLTLINQADRYTLARGYSTKPLVILFGFLSAIPILGILFVLGRYLARETDEYVRMMVVKSLLWAAAVIVIATTLQSALAEWSTEWVLSPNETACMTFDLFFTVASIVFVIQLWRNR
jgi:hypothetical protein